MKNFSFCHNDFKTFYNNVRKNKRLLNLDVNNVAKVEIADLLLSQCSSHNMFKVMYMGERFKTNKNRSSWYVWDEPKITHPNLFVYSFQVCLPWTVIGLICYNRFVWMEYEVVHPQF